MRRAWRGGVTRAVVLCTAWSLVALLGAASAWSDEIHLSGVSQPLQGEVLLMGAEGITLRLPREALAFVIMRPGNEAPERDNVGLRLSDGSRAEVRALVLELAPRQVTLRFPRERIASLVIGTPSQAVTADAPATPPGAALPAARERAAPRLLPRAPSPESVGLREEIRDLEHHVASLRRDLTEATRVPSGTVEGRVLWGGKPVTDAQVKLVRLVRLNLSESLGRLVGANSRGSPDTVEARTNADGLYRFPEVPAGWYAVYWKVPGGPWMRRLRDEPDVMLSAGATATVKDIEASHRSVN